MKRVYILCEGQTEESFVNSVLSPYFSNLNIILVPIICATKQTATKKYKGGVSHYSKIQNELQKICGQHKNEFVTTLFDYYAMPEDTPNIDCSNPDIFQRMVEIESSINEDLSIANFRFHFQLHEFEALLFSEPKTFQYIAEDDVVTQIQGIRDEFPSPEHINNSPETAPSKRLEKLIDGYGKVLDGITVAEEIGIDKMMKECQHFAQWVEMIKSWVR